jgi:ubiquinone/menaquinone biosynthesis C-methylase UbiE
VGFVAYVFLCDSSPALAIALVNLGGWPGISFLLTGLIMIWGSRFGKFRLRDRLLDRITWRGDEHVLDVGCGHGLLLVGAGKRLKTGKAVGVDLWQQEDQANNSAAATLENARLEGVADRVEVKDGDARKLPFPDASFDAVVSSWALHNIYDQQGRAQALREIVRVLKPGGQVALLDISHTAEYVQVLKESGLQEVRRPWSSLIFVIPTYAVTARKPTQAG